MKPEHDVSRRHLTVHDESLAVALDTARAETEHVDEEVVRGFDVIVDQERDRALDGGHGATVARSSPIYPVTTPG